MRVEFYDVPVGADFPAFLAAIREQLGGDVSRSRVATLAPDTPALRSLWTLVNSRRPGPGEAYVRAVLFNDGRPRVERVVFSADHLAGLIHLRQLNQGTRTVDCGYFCAYALKLAHDFPRDLERWRTTGESVRRARAAFNTAHGRSQSQLTTHFNTMVRFLAHLGLRCQAAPIATFVSPALTAQSFCDAVQRRLRPGRGVMLLLRGGSGHYVSVLPLAPQGRWHIYDPSPGNAVNFASLDRLAYVQRTRIRAISSQPVSPFSNPTLSLYETVSHVIS